MTSSFIFFSCQNIDEPINLKDIRYNEYLDVWRNLIQRADAVTWAERQSAAIRLVSNLTFNDNVQKKSHGKY